MGFGLKGLGFSILVLGFRGLGFRALVQGLEVLGLGLLKDLGLRSFLWGFLLTMSSSRILIWFCYGYKVKGMGPKYGTSGLKLRVHIGYITGI